MSTYKKITRHPNTGEYALATYHDDYFGQHMYGVEFPNDKVVYPFEQVEKAQLKEFWADDVIATLRDAMGKDEEWLIRFLSFLNIIYKNRWKRDPIGGEGAVDYLREKRGDYEE